MLCTFGAPRLQVRDVANQQDSSIKTQAFFLETVQISFTTYEVCMSLTNACGHPWMAELELRPDLNGKSLVKAGSQHSFNE